jgi:hypothetical protein
MFLVIPRFFILPVLILFHPVLSSIFSKSVYRVKALYDYLGTRPDDLSFSEDEILKAHPSKDTDSDWWYGTSLKTNNCGFFPRTYGEVVEKGKV